MTKPDAILVADLHLREDVPLCRTDDYFQAQHNKVKWLRKLKRKYECVVIVAGDIFNHWKPTPYLLSWALKVLPRFHAIPGQHDLPQHRFDLLGKSGFSVLQNARKLDMIITPDTPFSDLSGDPQESSISICGYPFGKPFERPAKRQGTGRNIAVAHVLTWHNKLPFPGCTSSNALSLLKRYPYDLIVTGDNHIPFVVEYKGRVLVNPGSMMRMKADQEQHRPRVYLWYAKSNTVKPVYFPIEEGVVSREHIEERKGQEERFQAFVQKLKEVDEELGLSFKRNLKTYFNKHRVRKEVMDIVWEAVDEK